MSICFAARTVAEWLVDIEPVALKLGVLEVRWYALSYLLGALFTYCYIKKAGKDIIPDAKFMDDLASWVIVGTLLGGRIAYVLLYNASFYLEFPLEILKVWHGGMSFHGGLIGCIVSIVTVCKKHRISTKVLDLCSCSIPFGIFLGRIANLINGELYGRVTSTCWGVIFPTSGDFLRRHPSQLYEALFEGMVPLILMNIIAASPYVRARSGILTGIFCTWYGIARCAVEVFREPDPHIGYIALDSVTMGQILSAPMIIAGIAIVVLSVKS